VTLVRQSGASGVCLGGATPPTVCTAVAGQGFNLALRGLMTLVEAIPLASEQGSNPGAACNIAAYQQLQPERPRANRWFFRLLIQIFGSAVAHRFVGQKWPA